MIKAAIFDLNGIFVQSQKLSERVERDFKIPASVFLSELFRIISQGRHPGANPAFTYWKSVLEKWKVNLSEKEFWAYWFRGEIPSEKMITFAKSLRGKGIKVFILSNNFKERSEYYSHYPWIHEAVDQIYFSWQTGFIKPDPRAWQQILEENNLKPDECIYFDDQEKNLKAAENLGIKSFMFTNEEDLEKTVNKYAI